MDFKLSLKRSAFAAMAAAALSVSIVAMAPATSGAATKASSSGGTATMALDENLAGFNINTSAASEYVLQEIMNMVWPQAFIVNNKLQPVLNHQLLESASVTSTDPQTVVYKLNPKAVWSDGTPITADDFIYNWQAQSGNPAYTDVGNQPYDDATTSGYNQIASVVGADPSGGAACDPGTAANRNVGLCPNGRDVTVTFKPSFADWRSLYTNIVPAHIARTVGWNTGFTGPTQVVSGSWFEIQTSNDQSVILVRNPHYWGTPGKLNKLVFQFFSDDSQLVPALQNKEINIFNPSTVNLNMVQTANQVPNTTKLTLPGLQFEHIDLNQADPYLAKLQVREAIAHGVNRQSIIARTVGQIDKRITPLGSRMLTPTQKGYKATPYAYNPSQSTKLLRRAGFKKGSDGYFQPNYGPQKGKDLTFTIQSTSGNSIRSQTEVLFQAQMKAIGIRINIQNVDADTFGTNIPSGDYQITEFAWVNTPFVSGDEPIYCSYTDTTNCASNWTHSANARVDQLMKSGSSAPSQSHEVEDYNKADAILWQNMVTLPLYQTPQFFAWSNDLRGVLPNTSSVGVTWNAENWSLHS